MLANHFLDSGDASRSLEIALAAIARAPKDPAFRVQAARALRRLGRLDDAQEATDKALELDRESGIAPAMAAAVAFDRGDRVAAQRWLDQSLELAPGEAFCLAIQAEIAVATAPKDQARHAVEQAIAAIRANPFLMLNTELVWLQQQLQKLSDDNAQTA